MIPVIENQTLLDIAIQETGTVFSVFDLAFENGLSITNTLVPGQKIEAIPIVQYEPDRFYYLLEKFIDKKPVIVNVIENQTLLDIAAQEAGTVLAVFDYAIANRLSITDTLQPSQKIELAPSKEYETDNFYYSTQKFIDKRSFVATVIENQSLLDVAIQEDGCVLAVFDWAFKNELSITDTLVPGQKIKMPKTELFRYDELANYFKSNNTMIATLTTAFNAEFEYYLPGEFPYSF